MLFILVVGLMSGAANVKPFSPLKPTVTQTKVIGGTAKQQARLQRISKQVEKMINSAEFKARLLGNFYGGKPGFYGSTETPAEVYKRMVQGDEFKRGKVDYVWQYELHVKQLRKNRLGSMIWPKDPIYFNSLYLDNRTDAGLAGTYCHEKAHQFGYTHSQKPTKQRPFSIPYVVGNICAEIYKKLKL